MITFRISEKQRKQSSPNPSLTKSSCLIVTFRTLWFDFMIFNFFTLTRYMTHLSHSVASFSSYAWSQLLLTHCLLRISLNCFLYQTQYALWHLFPGHRLPLNWNYQNITDLLQNITIVRHSFVTFLCLFLPLHLPTMNSALFSHFQYLIAIEEQIKRTFWL